MVHPKEYVVVIPAYNEEATIESALDHILKASQKTDGYRLKEIVVCINGCTDQTEELVRKWQKAPVKLIRSDFGYVNAINTLFKYVKKHHPYSAMVKTDADSEVDSDSFGFLFAQLEKHPDLIIAGGHPYPLDSGETSLRKKFLSKLFSARSRFPEAEITTTDTSRFHPYASKDSIPELKGREEKLKIYFHGRLWCARNSTLLPQLPSGVIGDDVYLPGWLIQEKGYGSMRLDYRAKVRFHPNDSIRRHWKVYRRIHEDRAIVYAIPGFTEYANACPLKLDWPYILKSLPANEALYFILYGALVRTEKVSYRFLAYQSSHWEYGKKEQ